MKEKETDTSDSEDNCDSSKVGSLPAQLNSVDLSGRANTI